MDKNFLLEAGSVGVRYGSLMALEGFSLTIRSGEGVSLLGLNGAGKTSALKALLKMIRYSGSVLWFGVKQFGPTVLKRIGFAPEDANPPEYLLIKEYLNFVASFRIADELKRKSEVEKWLNIFELVPNKRIGSCSKGMRRRVVLSQALIGSPELVVLDEPLNGLDPIIIIRLREELLKIRQSGSALLYSSHILTEVERTCGRAIFIRGGRIQLDDSIENVLKTHGGIEAAFTQYAGGGK